MANGEPIEVEEGGTRPRNPIHISDLVEFTIKSVSLCKVPPEIVNIAGKEVITIREIAEAAGRELDKKPIFKEIKPKFIALPLGDITKMKKLLGEPKISVWDRIHLAIKAQKEEM